MNKTSYEEEIKMKEYKEINTEKLEKVSGGSHQPAARTQDGNVSGRMRHERDFLPVVGIYTNW